MQLHPRRGRGFAEAREEEAAIVVVDKQRLPLQRALEDQVRMAADGEPGKA
jgi:hypothetical protein